MRQGNLLPVEILGGGLFIIQVQGVHVALLVGTCTLQSVPLNGKQCRHTSTSSHCHPARLPPCCRAHGFVFDQAAFVLSHRRKDKITSFLQQFRNSQVLDS